MKKMIALLLAAMLLLSLAACVYAGGMEPDALAKDLRKLLPKYMLPNLYEKLEALPYNANGKIDRVALKERYLHAEG